MSPHRVTVWFNSFWCLQNVSHNVHFNYSASRLMCYLKGQVVLGEGNLKGYQMLILVILETNHQQNIVKKKKKRRENSTVPSLLISTRVWTIRKPGYI